MGRTTNTQKTAEQKPKQEAKAPEQEPQKAAQAPEQAAQEPEQEPKQEEPDGRVMVEVVQTYKDLELKRIVKKGERLPMKTDRAAVIIGKKLGKAAED